MAMLVFPIVAVDAHSQSPARPRPLKVYILAGQSNMQGSAHQRTFAAIGDDPKTAPLLREILDSNGNPVVCDNAWITYLTGGRDGDTVLHGKVKVGYGFDSDRIGPEYAFGVYMDKAFDEPVLIIKTAWGGKSLAVDFRPPSAGHYEPSATEKERGSVPAREEVGHYYREMIRFVRATLKEVESIREVVPCYDRQQGYELAGFVWFQGWNDMCNPYHIEQYTDNMMHFISDVRKELDAPTMPFIVGILGVYGTDPDGRKFDKGLPVTTFRKAQFAAVEQYDQKAPARYRGHVIAVDSGPYYDLELSDIYWKRRLTNSWKRSVKQGKMTLEEQKEQWARYGFGDGELTPQEQDTWDRCASNAEYHYLGSAKTFICFGKALAEAMLKIDVPVATPGTGMSSDTSQRRPAVLKPDALWDYVQTFNSKDHTHFGQAISNEAAAHWMTSNVPLFECPDKDIEEIYYFRWWTFRKHIKETPDGYVITEFLPKVNWSGKHNTISCPAGHHFREGRWIHNPRYLDDYALFWFRKGGSPRSYSFWAADAIYHRSLVLGDFSRAIDLLPDLIVNYEAWEESLLEPDGLFWQTDDRDGMEVSIGGRGHRGQGKRATINSYMYGDALAIAAIAERAEKPVIAAAYRKKAEEIKRLVLDKLWDDDAQFFKVLPRGDGAELVGVRELHGFTPWYFNLPDQGEGYEAAWKQLMNPRGFYAPFGPTTAERRHPGFSVSYRGHECQWNGPSWPFATAVTLTALANVLNDYPQQFVSRADYFDMLKIYTKSHRLKRDDGTIVPWIDENLNPFTGDWIARTRLKAWKNGTWDQGKGGVERGKDYNHSTYCDLIITGLVGLRPRADDTVVINPLLPDDTWDYFCLDGVLYHGRLLTILYDKTGTKYGKGKGLRLLADGQEIGASAALGRLAVPLPSGPVRPSDARRDHQGKTLLEQPTDSKPKASTEASKKAHFDPVIKDIEGWTVHVDPQMLRGEHAEAGGRALKMLANHLQRITILMPEDRLEEMRKLEIWIEHDHPDINTEPGPYHPSVGWLTARGYDPRLAKKVHVTRAASLLERHHMLKHPAVILHELAHAYHDQVLGFDEPRIKAAYDRAMKAGLYDKVLLYTGQKVRHYAATDHKEYFAEGTEAYFYRNDFYPFVRAELKEHDPELHDLLEDIWGPLE